MVSDRGQGRVRVSVFRWIPGLEAISSYRRQRLVKDVVAGIVLTTLLVPQGMAYAEQAGLPPITGLYTSIMCLLGYAVFGPSRILVLGTDSSLGPRPDLQRQASASSSPNSMTPSAKKSNARA